MLKSAVAFSLHAGDDEFRSPAARAVRFQKTQAYWIDQRYGLFDGLVSNDQTSSRRYDRRLGVGLGAGVEQPLSPIFSLRLDLRSEVVKRRQVDAATPETTLDETYAVLRPLVAATYVTPAGLEIFGGVIWTVLPGYTRVIEASSDTTTQQYKTTHFATPHVGITRRGGLGAGGVYYQFGREQNRTVVKKAADGSILEMSETKQEPTTLGFFAAFLAAGGAWNVEVSAVSESEGGERTESGTSINDDHLELAVRSLWLNTWRTGLFYQTARYAKSAYMSLDSIPMAGAEVLWISDAGGQKIHFGCVGAFGRDKQSIPEMNARYEVNAVSVLGGIQSGF